MIKKIIIAFIVLLISVWLGIKIHANPGYVLISYEHWSIETSLWFALLLLVVFLIVIYILYRLIHGFFGISGRMHRWSDWRRLRKARKWTSRGLCELAEGNWKRAEKYLKHGADYSETPLINYLAAARAAQGQQAYERRDEYLRQAHASTEGAEAVAVGLTQAQLQLSSNQLERALATLRHLNQLVPHHAYVLKLLQIVYLQLSDWNGLLTLLPELSKYEILSAAQLEELERKVYSALLNQAAKSEVLSVLDEVWEVVPKTMRKDPVVLAVYTHYLIQRGENEKAEELLRDALKKNWAVELIDQYGVVSGADPAKQLNSAESWLKAHDHDPNLLLALGRICARNQLWGKAQNYLEASVKLGANIEAYRELGNVLEQLGDHKAAFECYKAGVQLKTLAVG